MSDGLQLFLLGLPLIGIGAYLDLLLMRRHKVWLYDSLYREWLFIEQNTVPDLARKAAVAITSAVHLPPSWKERLWAAGKALCVGWLSISVAAAIGGFMDGARDVNPYHWLPIFTVYLAVGGISIITMGLTYCTLRVLARGTRIAILVLLMANAGAGLIIALLALPVVSASANYAYINNWPGSGRGIYTILDDIVLVGWHIDRFYIDQAAEHFRKHPKEPYVFEADNWEVVDPETGIRHEATKFSLTLGPPKVPLDEWVKRMREPPDLEELVGRPPVEFYWADGPWGLYRRDLGDFLRDPLNWQPGAHGRLRALDGSLKISADALHLKFVPPWHIILSTAVIALPAMLTGFVLGALILAQLARKAVAGCASLAIERLAESDPRVEPARFLPFTVSFVALALCFAAVRLIARLFVSAI